MWTGSIEVCEAVSVCVFPPLPEIDVDGFRLESLPSTDPPNDLAYPQKVHLNLQ